MSVYEAQADPAAVEAGRPDPTGVYVTGVDLTKAVWKTSSYSGGNGSCVEVADLGEHVAVRDSKDKNGPKLVFTADAWRALLADLKAGAHKI